MQARELDVIIAGVGGQGNVRSAQILGSAAVKAGFRARVSDVFGIAQRGGPVLSHIRIGTEIYGSMVKDHGADIVLGLEPMECLRAVSKFLKLGGLAIMSERPIYPVEVNTGKMEYPKMGEMLRMIREVASKVIVLDATKVAEGFGIPIAANIVMLGVLAGTSALPFPPDLLKESIREVIPRSIEANLKAFDAGMSIGSKGA
ncbi:MAG: indolepyruvate oxidoreductase subunit beta [Candidatus Methanomethylicia archaeon]|nr:indolepyruvate oxidoreductase subunit beta [Candidatus Methanomethylicia archaeon]